jgi:anti-sigma B factor antagonist
MSTSGTTTHRSGAFGTEAPALRWRQASNENSTELQISIGESRGPSHCHSESGVVALTGTLDMATSSQVRRAIHQLVEAGQSQVVLDTAELAFVDVSGVNSLLGAAREAFDAGGWLRLRAPSANLGRILGLLELDRVLLIE